MKKSIKNICLILLACIIGISASFVNIGEASAASNTTSKTQVKTTVTTKKYKLSKASTSTKTITTTKVSKSQKVKENTSKKKVVENKTVKTTTKTSYKKKSKYKTVQTTKKTTTVTTTTLKSTTTTSTSALTKKADKKLVDTFNNLGFKVVIKKNLSKSGVFSPDRRVIEIKSSNADIYLHEMGHFLSSLKNKAGQSSEFKKIYSSEKSKYKGNNKSYVTSNSEEYFAESYRDYKINSSKLQKERPKTYKFMKNNINSISTADITKYKKQWSWAW